MQTIILMALVTIYIMFIVHHLILYKCLFQIGTVNFGPGFSIAVSISLYMYWYMSVCKSVLIPFSPTNTRIVLQKHFYYIGGFQWMNGRIKMKYYHGQFHFLNQWKVVTKGFSCTIYTVTVSRNRQLLTTRRFSIVDG